MFVVFEMTGVVVLGRCWGVAFADGVQLRTYPCATWKVSRGKAARLWGHSDGVDQGHGGGEGPRGTLGWPEQGC